MKGDKQPKRVSLWSVLNKYWAYLVWLLIVFLAVWTSLFVAAYDFAMYTEGDARTDNAPFESGSRIAVGLVFLKDYASYTIPVLMVVAVGFALLMDGKENLVMTITRWLRQKVDDEIRAEGKIEMHRAWAEWYRRLKEAERDGKPFDEPPPSI